ncbi:MAG: CPBP family intramembrane metalloprotease [Gemmatimonadaceae bacterium]|nr:CPBP family intramembrane metalloprotease [Gemmatimonadaceae bacterium]MCW5826876.1 CPBP family intramembrane metalloprotease [Gemmatimonadaceae bacterium]
MRLLAYFASTFFVTWSLWLLASRLAAPGNTGFFGGQGPVFLLGVFAPAIVALAFTARAEGRVGVAQLLARIGHWRVSARWYVFAIVYFAVIKLSAAVVHRLLTGEWPLFGTTPAVILLLGIAFSTLAQAGEEVGWRGYALPRLSAYLGLGGASLALGVVWAAWHIPLFVLPDSGSTGQSFLVYLLHVMALSVAVAYLYWKTDGSLLLVMLLHSAVNNTTGIVPTAVGGTIAPVAFGGSLVAWATVAISWVVAVPLLFQMRKADISAMRTPASR